MSDPLLSVNGIAKSFGAHRVLCDVQLSLGAGEIVGLLGPNGSGKSTLLNIISGFISSDAGAVVFAGRDISDLPAQSIAAAGLMRTFQLPSMPARMTVRDVLEAGRRPPLNFGTVFGRARPDPQVNELIDQFQLTAVADLPASALSGGQKKLLSIATAFRGRPRLLCLDEPTAGVHPNLRRRIVDILRALNALGVTLLVVEHDMAFIRELCRRCVVLDRGTLIADCAPEVLTDNPQVVEAYLGKAAQRTKVVA